MKESKRKAILAASVLLIIAAIYYLESLKVQPVHPSSTLMNTSNTKSNQDLDSAPELREITGYFNTDKITIKGELEKGNIVLVDFWTYTCINCIRTLPYLIEWDKKYRDKGLTIIGVHTPEFQFEKRYDNVKRAIEKYNIQYPVVQDNNYATWRAFGNNYWPRKYLIDTSGKIRYDHIGEGAYEETEKKIQELLREQGKKVNEEIFSGAPAVRKATTPELYAGFRFAEPRGQKVQNGELKGTRLWNYTFPEEGLEEDTIYIQGIWNPSFDDIEAFSEGSIRLNFLASEVNIVADGNTKMEVLIDGNYVTKENAGTDVEFDGKTAFVNVNQARLYNVYKGEYGRRTLELRINTPFSFNAFTFG